MNTRFCRRCDYDLSATAASPCPECGHSFSPADPRSTSTYPRHSLRGRIRQFRWPITILLALIAVWPRGWMLIEARWMDPVNASTVQATALSIGRPWWLGGHYPPIVWGSTSGAAPSTSLVGPNVAISISTRRAFTVLLRSDDYAVSRLSVLGLDEGPPSAAAAWPADIARSVRDVARATALGQSDSNSITINAPTPPWLDLNK